MGRALTDRAWGDALVLAARWNNQVHAEGLARAAVQFTDAERAPLQAAGGALLVHVDRPSDRPLAGRKHLRHWLRVLLTSLDGLVAVDNGANIPWSRAMLDDELAHDADVDVESAIALHCVVDEQADDQPVAWLHTHGLEELGGVDIDVLRPSAFLAGDVTEALRALAYASIEGTITARTYRFPFTSPDGAVGFLPVDTFQRKASPADATLRVPDGHSGRRVVACEPRAGGWLPPGATPSRLLQEIDGTAKVGFPPRAAASAAARALATLDTFRALAAEFGPTGLPLGITLGCATSNGGREDVWFLREWVIPSPAGSMTPRSPSAARRLRESGWPTGPFAALMKRPSG